MVASPDRLSNSARAVLVSPEHQLFLSAVSSWEIAIKYALGKLKLPKAPSELVPALMERTGVRGLPIEHAHALAVWSLPPHHRDPFDRLLVAQATVERLTILTSDREIGRYDVEVVEAS